MNDPDWAPEMVDTCNVSAGPKFDEKYCVGDVIDGIPYLKIVHDRESGSLPPANAPCHDEHIYAPLGQQDPCKNDGFCKNLDEFTDYECFCGFEYTGKNCEIFIPCSENP